MEELPVEVIEIIFKYLINLEDRKSASLVCQQWYRAYLHPYFRTLEEVHFTSEKHFKEFEEMDWEDRKYENFVMNSVEINENSLLFWHKCGPYIKNLTLNQCFMREHIFIKALSRCYKLESLTIHDCKELLMSGFFSSDDDERIKLRYAWQNLRTLSFTYNRYLSDAILIKVLALCPGVTSLILTGCQISYHNGMFRRFYPNGLRLPSESVTTFKVILRFISDNAKRIKTLSLSDTLLDGNSLYSLSLTKDLDLRKLQLRSCSQVSNQGLMQMCSTAQWKDLTELDLGLCPKITDTSLIIMCSSLRQIRKFSLQGCTSITDMGIANIWQMDKLESLNLSECESINGLGILKGLCYKTNKYLREFWMNQMYSLTEDTVIAMVEALPNLRLLELGHCYNAVSDISIQAVLKHCRWLRTFNIAMCERVTDCGLTGMGVTERFFRPSVNQLLHMPLGSRYEIEIRQEARMQEEIRQMCESEMLSAKTTGVSLTNLCGLQHLVLSGCNRISDISLKYAVKLPELQILDLSLMPRVTQEGLQHLVNNCSAIEDLNLDLSRNIDDQAVETVLRGFIRLKKLALGSDKVTNEIATLIRNHGLNLTHFDVLHCGRVTSEGVGHLHLCLPHLKSFQFREIPQHNERLVPPPPTALWLRRS